MRIARRPATRGFYWLSEGIRLLRRQPIGLLALTFLALMLMYLPTVLPAIGPLVSMALVPALYVGLMTAMQTAERGQMPSPTMLFAAFRAQNGKLWPRLLTLGLINAVATITVLAFSSLFFSTDIGSMTMDESTAEIERDPSAFVTPALVFIALYTPVQMAFWYAPLFVAWHDQPIGKSLFFSLAAVWRNKWSFVTMLMGLLGGLFALMFALRIVVTALGLSPAGVSVLLSPLSLVALAALYCTFWVTYRDVVDVD